MCQRSLNQIPDRSSSHHMVTSTIGMMRLSGVLTTLVVFCLQTLSVTSLSTTSVSKFALTMPDAMPRRPESYLCTPVKIDSSRTYYIVGFEPNANMSTAHHILIYGCEEPGSNQPIYNCGEMAASKDDPEPSSSPCGQGKPSQIIYAWARNAKRLELPQDVGFKVGKDSSIGYLVLQVHYAHMLPPGTKDQSGITLEHTEVVMAKQAGILLLGTTGSVPARSVEHMEVQCNMIEPKTIHPFAYRTHTHSLGKLVSGYLVRKNAVGEDEWTLLGKRDPLTPQMFYPIMDSGPIRQGDRLAARCTMESNRDRTTFVGATNEDEMCNFYLMYYVDSGEPLGQKYCFSPGPPHYYWRNPENDLHNIPELEASQL